MPEFKETYDEIAVACLGRHLSRRDSLSEAAVSRAEKRLGVRLPGAVRDYYRSAGKAADLNTVYNSLYELDDLDFDGEYLMFMDENQSVVSWGIARSDLGQADPIVWQRNNTPPVEWYSEELSFSAFMASMFEWYKSEDMWRGN